MAGSTVPRLSKLEEVTALVDLACSCGMKRTPTTFKYVFDNVYKDGNTASSFIDSVKDFVREATTE
jgi:hypothetical protein